MKNNKDVIKHMSLSERLELDIFEKRYFRRQRIMGFITLLITFTLVVLIHPIAYDIGGVLILTPMGLVLLFSREHVIYSQEWDEWEEYMEDLADMEREINEG